MQLESPILFIVFNRLECTKQVFNEIQKAKPKRLYISSDGSRDEIENEDFKVLEVRNYILNNIDWECQVKTLFHDKNLGCKKAVSKGIDWFFTNEEQGIILEDDCLPSSSFFTFCDSLLNYYKYDERVFVITGNNFQNSSFRINYSYYFSIYNHCWGWATWKRAWIKNDLNLSFYSSYVESKEWKEKFPIQRSRIFWERLFKKCINGEIDTWDYQWMASVWYNNGLTITPSVNLVTNIGFSMDATHTKNVNKNTSYLKRYELNIINHPPFIMHDKVADNYIFRYIFGGKYLFFPYNLIFSLKLIIKKITTK